MGPGLIIFVIIVIVLVIAALFWFSRRGQHSELDAASSQDGTRPGTARRKSAPDEVEKSLHSSVDDFYPAQESKREATNLFGEQKERAPGGADAPIAASAPTAEEDGTRAFTPPPPAPAPQSAPVPSPAKAAPSAPPPPPPSPAPVVRGPLPLSEEKATGATAAPQPAEPKPAPEPQTTALPAASTSIAAAEDVRFTAFHPKEVSVETWYTLLVYAHVQAALAKVQADATRFKQEMGTAPREVHSSAPAKLARGTEITILPEVEGVEFNPPRISFKWIEDMHRAEFRLRAGKDLAGSAANGTVTVFVGPLIVATIKMAMLFDDSTAAPVTPPVTTQATVSLYRQDQIFISYSHADTPIVLGCRDAYLALGYDVLIDIDKLRSGEHWNQALMELIDKADIFQLFWSANSSKSDYVHQEWHYALNKSAAKGEGFIRPVYWEKPLIPPPPELEPLHFAYVPLSKPAAS